MSILITEFEAIKNDLIEAYDSKGMRSSGQWANSLEVVQDSPLNVKILGLEYSQQLEIGRRSGTFPPSAMIEKWILEKGVFAAALQEISLSSLAFLIARKIAREGWYRKDYGGVELISEVITPERIQKIIDKIGVEQTIVYSKELITQIQTELV